MIKAELVTWRNGSGTEVKRKTLDAWLADNDQPPVIDISWSNGNRLNQDIYIDLNCLIDELTRHGYKIKAPKR